MSNSTRHSLIERLQNQSPDQSFSEFKRIYEPFLKRFVGKHLANDQDDLLQEVYIAVWQNIQRFDHNQQKGAFRKWLRSILHNRIRNRLAKSKRDRLEFTEWIDDLIQDDSELATEFDQQHTLYLLARARQFVRQKVTPQTWQTYVALVDEQQTVDEVVRSFGVAQNVVYKRRKRVNDMLREYIQGLVDGDL